jgi:DNA-binding protein YbaB
MTAWQERLARRIEAIDTAAADNRLRAESYRQMTEDLKAVDGTATSPDGLVTVVTGPGGVLKSITFSDAVRTVAPATLSAAVMHTVAKAQADVARTQADVVRRGLGSTELLDRVLSEEERLFGDERPRDPGPAPVVPQAGAHRRQDHDDFDDGYDVFQRPRR